MDHMLALSVTKAMMPCAKRALRNQRTNGLFLGTNELLSTAHCSYRQLEVPTAMAQFGELFDSLYSAADQRAANTSLTVCTAAIITRGANGSIFGDRS
jgi:hypothetical protein